MGIVEYYNILGFFFKVYQGSRMAAHPAQLIFLGNLTLRPGSLHVSDWRGALVLSNMVTIHLSEHFGLHMVTSIMQKPDPFFG